MSVVARIGREKGGGRGSNHPVNYPNPVLCSGRINTNATEAPPNRMRFARTPTSLSPPLSLSLPPQPDGRFPLTSFIASLPNAVT